VGTGAHPTVTDISEIIRTPDTQRVPYGGHSVPTRIMHSDTSTGNSPDNINIFI